jgi:hypothetical protein
VPLPDPVAVQLAKAIPRMRAPNNVAVVTAVFLEKIFFLIFSS